MEVLKFQSHAGSIEAARMRKAAIFLISFQSHAGSIEAGCKLINTAMFLLFQSHAGSIEAPDADQDGKPDRSVSIPRWFD